MEVQLLRFSGRGVSDVGLVRPHNEDSGFAGPYVALVADGVGGAAAGEIASATAAYAVAATCLAAGPDEPPEQVITRAVEAAVANIRRGVQSDLNRLGMATTLSVLVCDGSRVVLGHVGDSRAYHLTGGRLVQISRDHTYVQHLVESGQLDREGIRSHPWRNVVLRSLDGDPEGQGVDLVAVPVVAGDRLLLCSDGLTDLVRDERIAEILQLRDPHSAAAVLTQAALSAGGRDNITCVVLDVVDGPRVVGDGQLLGALADIANIVDPGAVRFA